MQPNDASSGAATSCKRCNGQCRDRRHRAKPPATRGKRGRPTIAEIPGLAEWMETQFKLVPRPSFTEIEERLKRTNFWPKILASGRRTGKSSVHTWWLKWTADIARKRVAAEFASAFNQGSGKEILEIETAITGLANLAILEGIRQEIDGKNTVTDKASKLIELHRRLQSSSARREAERRAAGRTERLAIEKVRKEMVSELDKEPAARKVFLDALARVEEAARLSRGDSPTATDESETATQHAA